MFCISLFGFWRVQTNLTEVETAEDFKFVVLIKPLFYFVFSVYCHLEENPATNCGLDEIFSQLGLLYTNSF